MSKSIKIDSNLWKRVEEAARRAGYSSPEELIDHALQKELARLEESDAAETVTERLKGLGYLE